MKLRNVKGKHQLSTHAVWMFLMIGLIIIALKLPAMQCPFHSITGLPCLSCGATRALTCLQNGDISGLFYNNPLLVIFCFGLFFFSLFKVAEFIFKFEFKLVFSRRFSLAARMTAIVLIAANWLFLIVTGR